MTATAPQYGEAEDATPAPVKKGPRPPKWWTEENTAAWTAEVWGGTGKVSRAQRTWGGKLTRGVVPGKFPPPTATQRKAWAKQRAADPRPTPVTFYDGRVDHKRLNLGRAGR